MLPDTENKNVAKRISPQIALSSVTKLVHNYKDM